MTKRVLAVDFGPGQTATRCTHREYTHAVTWINGRTQQREAWSWHSSAKLAEKEIRRVKNRLGWSCESFTIHETRVHLGEPLGQ